MDDKNNLTEDNDKSFPSTSINNINFANTLEAALYYNSLGFNVIPIPKPNERIGLTVADGKSAKGYGSWSQWISKKQTKEDVRKLFEDKRDCNIGIITGSISSIIVF